MGKCALAWSSATGRVRFSVTDRGLEWPGGVPGRIFEKFGQARPGAAVRVPAGSASPSASWRSRPTAVRIGVESSETGGARFWVELPRLRQKSTRGAFHVDGKWSGSLAVAPPVRSGEGTRPGKPVDQIPPALVSGTRNSQPGVPQPDLSPAARLPPPTCSGSDGGDSPPLKPQSTMEFASSYRSRLRPGKTSPRAPGLTP